MSPFLFISHARTLGRRCRSALRTGAESLRADDGAATAEYAIVIMAGVSFAGVLVTILRSGQIQGVLTDLVQNALTVH